VRKHAAARTGTARLAETRTVDLDGKANLRRRVDPAETIVTNQMAARLAVNRADRDFRIANRRMSFGAAQARCTA
jgi:hypothetical protein